jgi:hypothetical protein
MALALRVQLGVFGTRIKAQLGWLLLQHVTAAAAAVFGLGTKYYRQLHCNVNDSVPYPAHYG